MLIVLACMPLGHRIADMWKHHFKGLYSTGANSKYRNLLTEKLSHLASTEADVSCLFTMVDVFRAL